MKFFKSIDLYGKLPQGLAEPTNSGAVVSVFTMILLTLLILTEVMEWVTMDVKSDIYVDDRHSQEKVNVNMNILFPKLPCEFLDVDAFDSMGQMVKDENKMFRLYRTDSAQNIIEIYNTTFNIEQARRQLEGQNGCQVAGFIMVNKVPGKISFGAHRTHHLIQNVQKGLVLDLSHVFQHLSFGLDADIQQISSQFRQGQLLTLEGSSRIKPESSKNIPVQHEHFISIVPTTFTLLNKREFSVYQYTANHNEIRAQYYPQMILRYEISPVTFKYWQTKEDVLHFLVQICAIIGGIFTVSGMIESLVHRAMSLFSKQ